MPPTKGAIWEFFYLGAKQNASHWRAHCYGCLDKARPDDQAIELDDDGKPKFLASDAWLIEACKSDVGGVLGVKDSMIAHILGKGGASACPHASKKARKVARTLKEGTKPGKRAQDESSSSESSDEGDKPTGRQKKKRKVLTQVKASMKQGPLKVFRGLNIPFTEAQTGIVHQQTLAATISANLPYRWIENPEVIKLFLLFRSTADEVLPSRLQLSGPLLDNESKRVEEELKTEIEGKYAVLSTDGWKDVSRDSVNGVSLSVEGKAHLVELVLATAHKKDGASMCKSFEEMLDRAEETYNVVIVAFCCDNDGGSQRGRKDLIIARPWLFGVACCAHQFQLILGEYFRVSEEAAQTSEEATDLIGWVFNHQRVRSIFNEMQAEISKPPGKVLAFLAANLTRWTTHLIAFARLLELKDALRRAVISRKQDIVDAQVGAEKNRQKRMKLEDEANMYCDLIDNADFWRRLQAVVNDLEPICLALNMNQTDSMRADEAALSFAGVFLHFKKHPNSHVRSEMTKRIEKRWKAMDEPMFILALVLNPFEGLTRFGTQAGVNDFTLVTLLIETYRRVRSRPPKEPRSASDAADHAATQARNEKAVSEAFMSYLSGTGAFSDWEANKEHFLEVNGKDPIAVWKAFVRDPKTSELADFAILLLSITVNQAGLERNFSDLKVKKSNIRNRIKLGRLEKMAKVGANIREHQKEDGLVAGRSKRHNHDDGKVGELLAVPRYADLLNNADADDAAEDSEGRVPGSGGPLLIKSRAGWRKEMAKWIEGEKEKELTDDEPTDEQLASAMYGRKRSKWLPRSLELLFGDRPETDIDKQLERTRRRNAHTEEARLMELLIDEEEGEQYPDDGEREGSGDNFDG